MIDLLLRGILECYSVFMPLNYAENLYIT